MDTEKRPAIKILYKKLWSASKELVDFIEKREVFDDVKYFPDKDGDIDSNYYKTAEFQKLIDNLKLLL